MQSQNGAEVIATDDGEAFYGSPDLTSKVIPGTNGTKYLGGLRVGDVDVVLRYSGAWWNANIEPVVQSAGCWGYDFRSIRGQASGYSNHASATAADTNAAQHPLGTRTLGLAKLAKLADLRETLRGVVRYGAFYIGRVDEMHAEINDFGPALADLAADIRAGRMVQNFEDLLDGSVRDNIPGRPGTPTPTPTPTPVPPLPPQEDDDMTMRVLYILGTDKTIWQTSDLVTRVAVPSMDRLKDAIWNSRNILLPDGTPVAELYFLAGSWVKLTNADQIKEEFAQANVDQFGVKAK